MTEDSQPNERPLSRKGGFIPSIRSTHQFKSDHATTRYSHRPLNQHHIGAYPFVIAHNEQQYNYPPKRLQKPHDGPHSRRKWLDLETSTNSPSQHETANSFRPIHNAAVKPLRKATKRKTHGEPIELLVDLPPQCRKGAPDCQRIRKEWQAQQVQELSTKTGVLLQCAGLFRGCARFVIDNKASSGVKEMNNSRATIQLEAHAPPSLQPAAPLHPSVASDDANDEIVVVETPDTLSVLHEPDFILLSPLNANSPPGSPEAREQARSQTEEPFEPHRAFSSGVLSFSFGCPENGSFSSSTPHNTASSSLPFNGSTSSAHTIPRVTTYCSESSNYSGPVPMHIQPLPALVPTASTRLLLHPFNHEIETIDIIGSTSQFTLIPERPSIQIPLFQSDKSRRILKLDGTSFLSVSMRGSVDIVDTVSLKHRRNLKSPQSGESVDDACLVQVGDEFATIFGLARDREQLLWCHFHSATSQSEAISLPRPLHPGKKGGVSAVAPMLQPLQFATGGYDHIVHLWDVKTDLSFASPQPLAIKHTSQVQSLLAIRDTSHKLISAGADCNVHIWDLSSERIVNTLRPSNATYHLHSTINPFCTLLEVAHRELQFEVRDRRLVPECPVLRFGYSTDKVHGRFVKGATSSHLFACGSRDGSVRIWDLRNVKSTPLHTTALQGQKVVQVFFQPSQLVVCSEGGQTSVLRYTMDQTEAVNA